MNQWTIFVKSVKAKTIEGDFESAKKEFVKHAHVCKGNDCYLAIGNVDKLPLYVYGHAYIPSGKRYIP